ncbi:MAG TPA: HDOD domain-containing protein [Geobacteraceae bacterium]|nr:HDOD domain-containing protein [Geobacteraceae bacterium]
MPESISIVEVINKNIEDGNLNIPVFNSVALRLQKVLTSKDYGVDEVNRLIIADPGLASQVLRVSNSSFYAGLSKVTTIRDAIVRLGASCVANIAMLATQQDIYRSSDPRLNEIMRALWRHALCCAIGAKWLAAKTNFASLKEEAFLAGLLHDIGKLFLLKVMEKIIREEKQNGAISPALISEVMESMHVAQGANLMQKWNMPETYCAVVHDHHADKWDQGNALLAIVRLANQTCRKIGVHISPDPSLVLFASAEAQVLGVREITLAELEIVIEDAIKQI